MEYDLISFTNRLIELFVNSPNMPKMNDVYIDKYGREQKDEIKHKNRPTPRDLKSQISNSMISSKMGDENMRTFDLGNAQMETNFPYYHILQQAPTIRKKDKGTTKSKGSESMYKNPAERDYERVYWNGKTFTKEYSKNVRGARTKLTKTSYWSDYKTSSGSFKNPEAQKYLNVHYQYIDKILNEDVVKQLASEFGLKIGRTQKTDLVDEFAMQEGVSVEQVLEAFDSFM